MKHTKYLLLGSVLLFAACADNAEQETKEEANTQPTIEFSIPEGSPEYDGATISIANVTSTPDGDNVKVGFSFNVENYELKSQTADADAKMCANSGKGQHIHFILDNKPYAALYDPKHEVTLEKNSEHYLLAFLSRSYHESVKSDGASLVYHFRIDENGKVEELDAPTTPMLFYSRPKGTYIGAKNTDKLLFDFFLHNTEIGQDGNHVLAHIKGNNVDTTVVVKDWRAYFLHNMPLGNPSIELTLVDKDGNPIEGPMTNVTREFTLAAEEPLPAE